MTTTITAAKSETKAQKTKRIRFDTQHAACRTVE